MEWDFTSYHYRAMNAKSEEEKQEINQELKDLYETLSEEEKVAFNTQLQKFLVSEYAKIQSMTQGVKRNTEDSA